MREALLIATVVSLGACAAHTMEGMRARTPILTASSQKPVEVLGPCLITATDKLGIATYLPGAHGATFEVQVGGTYGGKTVLITGEIADSGDRRQITIWTIKPLFTARISHAVERMRACL